MALNQRNLLSLALRNEIVGVEIQTDKGQFIVLSFEEYDSMTHTFTLEVQESSSGDVSIREFSDKFKYEIIETNDKRTPNDRRLKPKKR